MNKIRLKIIKTHRERSGISKSETYLVGDNYHLTEEELLAIEVKLNEHIPNMRFHIEVINEG